VTPETRKKSVSFLADSFDAPLENKQEKQPTKLYEQTDVNNPRACLRGALSSDGRSRLSTSLGTTMHSAAPLDRLASTEREKRTCASGPIDGWCNSGEPDDCSLCDQSVSDQSKLLTTVRKSQSTGKSGSNWLADIVEKRKQKAMERLSVERLSIPKDNSIDKINKVKRVAFSENEKNTMVNDRPTIPSKQKLSEEAHHQGISGEALVNLTEKTEKPIWHPVVNLKPCLKLSRSFEIPEAETDRELSRDRFLNSTGNRKLIVTPDLKDKLPLSNSKVRHTGHKSEMCPVLVPGDHLDCHSIEPETAGIIRSHSRPTVKLYLNTSGEFESSEPSRTGGMGRLNWHSIHENPDTPFSNMSRRPSQSRNSNNDRVTYVNQEPEVSWILKLEPTVIVRAGSLKNIQMPSSYSPTITRNRNSLNTSRHSFQDFDGGTENLIKNGRRPSSMSDRYRKIVSGDFGGTATTELGQRKLYGSSGYRSSRATDTDRRYYPKADFAIYI